MITAGGEAEGTGAQLRTGPCRSLRRTKTLWSSCCMCGWARHRWYVATPRGRVRAFRGGLERLLRRVHPGVQPRGSEYVDGRRAARVVHGELQRPCGGARAASDGHVGSDPPDDGLGLRRGRANGGVPGGRGHHDWCDRSGARNHGRLIGRTPGQEPGEVHPHPYSPECVKGEFSEVRLEKAPKLVHLGDALVATRVLSCSGNVARGRRFGHPPFCSTPMWKGI